MVTIESHTRVERYRFNSFDPREAAPPVVIEQNPATPAVQAQQQAEAALILSEPVAPPPPPSFSEQEMEAAKKAAYQAGLTAGEQQANEKRNKDAEAAAASLRSLLEVVANRITLASEDHGNFLKSQQEMNLKLSLSIARKIAGDALKREPYSSVEALLKECSGVIGGNERIVITVAAQKVDGLRQSIESLKPFLGNFEGQVDVEQDEALAENDCRVEWRNGQATRNTEKLWGDIEALLRKTVLTS